MAEKEQKHWSKEDEQKLKELLGTQSYKTIAKILGRTQKAISEKRNSMELGSTNQATEYLNANQLAEALKRTSATIRAWINKRGLPHTKRVLANERKFYRIDVDLFWKWAKKNNGLMRWDLYELGTLPGEPKWILKEKENYIKPKRRTWTQTDNTYLMFYYKQGMKLKEIGEKLDRTEKAIDQRLVDLKAKRKIIQLGWKEEEEKTLTEMRKQGKTFEFIAEELGRSTDGVKAKSYYIDRKTSLAY